jgi:large subunit ribosomal protein L6
MYLTRSSFTETFDGQSNMSRIGKKIMNIPAGVNVVLDTAANTVKVTGKLGELSETLLPFVTIKQDGDTLTLEIQKENDKFQRSIWGTSRALVANMLTGVSEGYKKELELNGVGFKMDLVGADLKLAIGFSHPVIVPIPKEVKVVLDKNMLTATSFNKQVLGHFVQYVHDLKPCDPYKHKGFKYPGKFYPKKVGKKMSK